MKIKPPAYRPDIDGLRALAVLLVVGYHYFWVAGGYIGVDIFFVISGYLISQQILIDLDRKSFSLMNFYARRVRRILPPLLLMISLCLLAGWFLLLPTDFKQLGAQALAGVAYVSNFLLYTQSGYFDAPAAEKPFLHLWSLGIEEQFYLFWPLLLIILAHFRQKASSWIVGVTILSFGINLALIDFDRSAAFYMPASRFWELAAGGLIASLSNKAGSDSSSLASRVVARTMPWATPVALTLILTAVLSVDKQSAYPGYWATLPVLGSCLLLADRKGDRLKSKLFSNFGAVWVGRLSYSIYLWHWPLLIFMQLSDRHTRTDILTALFGTFVFAWLSYRYVEVPIRALKITPHNASRFVIAGLCVSVVIGLFGLSATNAWVERSWDHDLITKVYEHPPTSCAASAAEGNASKLDELAPCLSIKYPGRPTVFLLGDSHALGLSLGLQDYLSRYQINLVALPVMYCTPLSVHDRRQACVQFNQWIEAQIKVMKPDLVLIFAHHAFWGDDESYGEAQPYPAYLFNRALEIKQASAGQVLVVGQIPTWVNSLPHNLNLNFLRRHMAVPSKTTIGVDENSLAMDGILAKTAANMPIPYLSLVQQLCDAQGCQTSVGKNFPDDLFVHDYGHLTKNGAAYISEKILWPEILSRLPVKP